MPVLFCELNGVDPNDCISSFAIFQYHLISLYNLSLFHVSVVFFAIGPTPFVAFCNITTVCYFCNITFSNATFVGLKLCDCCYFCKIVVLFLYARVKLFGFFPSVPVCRVNETWRGNLPVSSTKIVFTSPRCILSLRFPATKPIAILFCFCVCVIYRTIGAGYGSAVLFFNRFISFPFCIYVCTELKL